MDTRNLRLCVYCTLERHSTNALLNPEARAAALLEMEDRLDADLARKLKDFLDAHMPKADLIHIETLMGIVDHQNHLLK